MDPEKRKYKYLYPETLEQGGLFCSNKFSLRFPELDDSVINMGFFKMMAWMADWKYSYTNSSQPEDMDQLRRDLPTEVPDFKCPVDKIRYTWIGHSTAVISIGGRYNILVDPVFSQRCSPVQLVGPRRYFPPPCLVAGLPKIDLVLVSHDHYDHLDYPALVQLQNAFKPFFILGKNSQDVIPPGASYKCLGWTQTLKLQLNGQSLEITFVPACHWSRRGANDTNQRLWGGFVIKTAEGKKIFYSGDTGYCEVFKEIRQQYGQFDLCLLPIGAYYPRQKLSCQHVDPTQAVQIHKELGSKKSVGVHWGTFPLGYQHPVEPRTQLKKILEKEKLKEDSFITINHGASFQIDL